MAEPGALLERLLARERDAVPEALNLSDDRRPEARARALALLDALERRLPFPGAARIGITGAPGAGKSTLLDALLRALRARGETLALVAVDPSSQKSGGALLGDRIRVRSGAADPGVFIRSMAARDRLGGVSESTRAGLTILAAVFDRVFVETVGVGQSEADVASLVDTLVFAVDPGSGDTLQFMKAGILELPDVFAVTKTDGEARALAERTRGELESGLGLSQPREAGWKPPVIPTSAREGRGVEALLEAVDAHGRHLIESGTLRDRRQRGRALHVVATLAQRYGSFGLAQLGGREALLRRLRDEREASSFALIEKLGREIEEALRKPGGSAA